MQGGCQNHENRRIRQKSASIEFGGKREGLKVAAMEAPRLHIDRSKDGASLRMS